MSSVAVIVSVAASKKCTLCAVLAVTIRWGPPFRLLRSNIASSAKIGGSHPHEAGGTDRRRPGSVSGLSTQETSHAGRASGSAPPYAKDAGPPARDHGPSARGHQKGGRAAVQGDVRDRRRSPRRPGQGIRGL